MQARLKEPQQVVILLQKCIVLDFGPPCNLNLVWEKTIRIWEGLVFNPQLFCLVILLQANDQITHLPFNIIAPSQSFYIVF